MLIQQKLNHIINKNNSLVCVGLDSDFDKLPVHLKSGKYPQFKFNKAIIDKTFDQVCAYKPNSAFYEARGENGIIELKMTVDYIRKNYPDIVTILDAKRADIGSTNKGYVTSIFDYMGFDAVTLQPYLGYEAIQPFLKRKDKACIILCRTSNPGAGEFQDLKIKGIPLYQIIAKNVETSWNINKNCMLVVGGTFPQELKQVRKIAKDMTFLVPGVGAQRADIEATVCAGINSKKAGMIINSSRAIIFASNNENFATKARAMTILLKNQINSFR